jgi:predicted metalloprotease
MCFNDDTMYYVAKKARENEEQYGPFTLAYTVAHEWGHYVQLQLGYLPQPHTSEDSNSRAIEDHADCLAGVWTRSYQESGHLDDGAIFEGVNFAYAIGKDQREEGGKGWGTHEERVRWFLTGYTSGDLSGCSGALA